MIKCCRNCSNFYNNVCSELLADVNPYVDFINPLVESGEIIKALEESGEEVDESIAEKIFIVLSNKLDHTEECYFVPYDDREFYCEKWR